MPDTEGDILKPFCRLLEDSTDLSLFSMRARWSVSSTSVRGSQAEEHHCEYTCISFSMPTTSSPSRTQETCLGTASSPSAVHSSMLRTHTHCSSSTAVGTVIALVFCTTRLQHHRAFQFSDLFQILDSDLMYSDMFVVLQITYT